MRNLSQFRFYSYTHSSAFGSMSLSPKEACLLKGVQLQNPQPPGPETTCPSPLRPPCSLASGCELGVTVPASVGQSQPKGSGGTAGPAGLPSVGGVLGAKGETEKLSLGQRAVSSRKERKKEIFFWFQLLVKLLAENTCVGLFLQKKLKEWSAAPSPGTALRGGGFELPLPAAGAWRTRLFGVKSRASQGLSFLEPSCTPSVGLTLSFYKIFIKVKCAHRPKLRRRRLFAAHFGAGGVRTPQTSTPRARTGR